MTGWLLPARDTGRIRCRAFRRTGRRRPRAGGL